MPTGEAWIWSPEFMEIFKRIKIRKRETFHPDREKLGMTFKMPEIKQGDIQNFIDKFKTPKSLPKDFGVLKEGKVIGEDKHKCIDPTDMIQKAIQLERAICEKAFEKERAEMKRKYNALYKTVEHIGRLVAGVAQEDFVSTTIIPTTNRHVQVVATARAAGDIPVDSVDINGGAKRMLATLASRTDGMTRQQLATFAGMKVKGSSFRTYMSRLKSANHIVESNDMVNITAEGREFIGPQEQVNNSVQVRASWLSKMNGGARNMLQTLIDVYPQEVTKEYLAETNNMLAHGSSFRTYISRLKGNGLITVDGHGHVRASDTLFQE